MSKELLSKMKKQTIKHYYDFFETAFPSTCIKPYIYFLKEYYKNHRNLVGVEIGVYLGHNSFNLCDCLSMQQLYLIDPYCKYVQEGIEFDTTPLEQKAHKRMKPFDDKLVWMRKYSEECHNDLPSNLDFIYIDGNHTYEYIKKDIELFYPKLKKGGIMGGDDFNASYLGVVKAVMEFCHGYKVKLQGCESDWWCIKE